MRREGGVMRDLIGLSVALLVSAVGWVGLYHGLVWLASHPEALVRLVSLGLLLAGSWVVLLALVEVER